MYIHNPIILEWPRSRYFLYIPHIYLLLLFKRGMRHNIYWHFYLLTHFVVISISFQIQFEKSYDIFSGSLYRGHFVVRNHLQVDKFTNLVSLPMRTTKQSCILSALLDELLELFYDYDYSMHSKFSFFYGKIAMI